MSVAQPLSKAIAPPGQGATHGGMADHEVARWSAWDRFVAATPDTGFMQSSSWAQFRARAAGGGHFAVTVKDGDAIVGGAVVGKWPYEPGHCFYYVQEGPVLPADEASAAEVFNAALERIERHRKAEDATVSHLRIEPRWQRLPEFVRGFRPLASADRFSEPRNTLCIDLRPSEDEILAQMKPKGRYNVRVARKHGVTVVKDNSLQGTIDFIRIQRCTAVRKGIQPVHSSYFDAMLAELVARGHASLFFAECGAVRLATALVVTFGRRATYLFGGSLLVQRHVMAPYLLHFEIMRTAKAWGCDWYDLWGVAPLDQRDHAWQQISKFKRKLGGVDVELVPTLDYVYDEAAYDQFRIAARSAATPPKAHASPSRSERNGNGTQTLEPPVATTPPSDTSHAVAGVKIFDPAVSRVKLFDPAVPRGQFNALRHAFPESHFWRLLGERFRFYQTTFWYPLDRAPENVFESIIDSLRPLAQPSPSVIGVEWWFGVKLTNSTPQWLLPCHFDRNDLDEKDLTRIRHPETASVLFVNTVPYGELVVTDQVLSDKGPQPQQPKDMHFISPKANRYVTFAGHLYHGVIGRMWRPVKDTKLRITMAVNWWTEKPKAAYLNDSRGCMAALRLKA